MRPHLFLGAALAAVVLGHAHAEMTSDDADFLGTSQACNPKAGVYCLKSAPNRVAPAATAAPSAVRVNPQQQAGLQRLAALRAFVDQMCATQSDADCQRLRVLGEVQTHVQNPMALTAEKRLEYLLPAYAGQCAQPGNSGCAVTWRAISALAKAALQARGETDQATDDSQTSGCRQIQGGPRPQYDLSGCPRDAGGNIEAPAADDTAGCRQIQGEPRPQYDLSGCPRPPRYIKFTPLVGPPASLKNPVKSP